MIHENGPPLVSMSYFLYVFTLLLNMNTFILKEGWHVFTQANLFLILLLAIALIAKNQSLLFAVSVLLIIKIVGLDQKLFPTIQSKGINWGVTIITIAVLVPIATGEIGFKQLGEAMRSSYAWIALGAGIAVALIAKNGLTLLENDPHITNCSRDRDHSCGCAFWRSCGGTADRSGDCLFSHADRKTVHFIKKSGLKAAFFYAKTRK